MAARSGGRAVSCIRSREDGHQGGVGRAKAHRAEHGTGWAPRTGKEEDTEVGLQYFGKRYLNPLLGRWISADPLAVHAPGRADLNLYAYVSGGVLKNVDPLGLEGETAHRMLVFKNEQLRGYVGTSEMHFKNMASLGQDWRAKGGGKLYQTAANQGDGSVSGRQHLKAIGSMAKQGAVEGQKQHLHIVTHGGLDGQDEKGDPANAGITLGSDKASSIDITTEMLDMDPNQVGDDAVRAELRRMNVALDQLKADLKAGNVSDLTIHGCNVGRSQEFLDKLSNRLGVNVHSFDSSLKTDSRTDQLGNVTPGTAQEGVGGPAVFNSATGAWQDGPGEGQKEEPGNLLPANSHSAGASGAGDAGSTGRKK